MRKELCSDKFTMLNLCMLANFACFYLSADFFLQNMHFQKIISGIPSECQTVWIQIRPDILSGLIWVQTVCTGHQQTKKEAAANKELK